MPEKGRSPQHHRGELCGDEQAELLPLCFGQGADFGILIPKGITHPSQSIPTPTGTAPQRYPTFSTRNRNFRIYTPSYSSRCFTQHSLQHGCLPQSHAPVLWIGGNRLNISVFMGWLVPQYHRLTQNPQSTLLLQFSSRVARWAHRTSLSDHQAPLHLPVVPQHVRTHTTRHD